MATTGRLLLTFIFASGYLLCAAEEGWRCNQLASAMEHLWDVYLSDLQPEDPANYQLQLFFEHTGFSLNSTDGRHTLACHIVDAFDLNSLSESLNTPYLRLYHHYKLLETILENGGGMMTYYHFLTGLDLFLERFGNWAEVTNFPDVPINSTYAEALEFFKSLRADFGNRVFKEVSHEMPFISDMGPEDLATAIIEAEDEQDLIARLHTSRWAIHFALDSFMETEFIGHFYRLLRTLVHTQLLPMEYTGNPYHDLRLNAEDSSDECQEIHDFFLDVLEASQDTELNMYGGLFSVSMLLQRDFLDPDVLLDFACGISNCESIEDLAVFTNTDLAQLQQLQQAIPQNVNLYYGGRQGMKIMNDQLEIFLEFGDHTGFPVFPLHDVTRDDVMAFLISIHPGPDGDTQPSHVYSIFPMDVDAEEIADIMIAADSFEECFDELYRDAPEYPPKPQLDDVQFVMDVTIPAVLKNLQLVSRALDLAVQQGFIQLE